MASCHTVFLRNGLRAVQETRTQTGRSQDRTELQPVQNSVPILKKLIRRY